VADETVNFNLIGKDHVSPATRTAAAGLDHADKSAKTLGQTLIDLKPRGETISVVMQGLAVATGAVAGAFAAAASQSEALQGQLGRVSEAGKGTLKSLGDAIAESDTFRRTMNSLVGGLGDLEKWIGMNKRAVDDLVHLAMVPLATAASLAIQSLSGLAQTIAIVAEVAKPSTAKGIWAELNIMLQENVVEPIGGALGGRGYKAQTAQFKADSLAAAGGGSAAAGIERLLVNLESIQRGQEVFQQAVRDLLAGKGSTAALAPVRSSGGASRSRGDAMSFSSEQAEFDWGLAWPSSGVPSWAGRSLMSDGRAEKDMAKSGRFFGGSSNGSAGAVSPTDWGNVAKQVESSFSLVAQAAQELGGVFGILGQQTISAISTMAAGGGRLATGIASGDPFGIISGGISLLGGFAGLFGSSSRSYTDRAPLPVAIVEDRRPRTPIVVYLSMPSGASARLVGATSEPY
jgi:hypothetical protein